MIKPASSKFVALATLLLAVGGCSVFDTSKSTKAKEPEPRATKLTSFDAEVQVKRLWGAKVGSGLGRKYVRLQPALLADRVYACLLYTSPSPRDRG